VPLTQSVFQVDTVCLWLGANVMMEFTFDEAETLLQKNLKTCSENLALVDEQLSFLRDQVHHSRQYRYVMHIRPGLLRIGHSTDLVLCPAHAQHVSLCMYVFHHNTLILMSCCAFASLRFVAPMKRL
jgi:hypothetical protein